MISQKTKERISNEAREYWLNTKGDQGELDYIAGAEAEATRAEGLVEKEPGYYDTYREYERDGPWVNDIAVNSLHSLLRANGLNPETNFLLIKKTA